MTTTIPLDAMVRRASRMAEQMFDEEGEIDMFWVIDTPAGIINVLSPIFAKSVTESREHKDAINEAMRELLREHEATRYVRVAEAWTTEKVSSTSELPDDESTVFVTNVAESPIQILGRRNRSGKLFVGSVVSGPPRDPITGEAETLERVVATAPDRPGGGRPRFQDSGGNGLAGQRLRRACRPPAPQRDGRDLGQRWT